MKDLKVSDLAKTNLLRLLSQFSRKELNEFEKFIKSPLYNNQTTLIRLYSELIKFYPDFNHLKFTKENLYKSVKPDSAYNDVQLRKYFSNLYLLGEEYLKYLENKSNKERSRLDLIYQFDKRNLTDFYNKIVAEYKKTENTKNFISNKYFCNHHFFEELQLIHHIRINDLESIFPRLINSHNKIILQLMLVSTVYSNILLVNKKLFKKSENDKYFENFLKHFNFEEFFKTVESTSEEEKLFVELCKFDLLLTKDPENEIYLIKMNELVFKMAEYFNDNLLYTFISHLNIFYLINIQKGYDKYEKEVFANFKYMIENGLYVNEGQKFINYSEFRTILNTAVNLKEYEWSERFITDYGKNLSKPGYDSYENYSLAYIRFCQKKYETALTHLSMVKPDEMILKLDMNILYAMIYFEMNYRDSAFSVVDTFKHFIKSNNKLSEEIRINHLNFLKYFVLIINLRNNNLDLNKADMIRKEIYDFKYLMRKSWLIEKLDEMLNNK